MILTRSEWKGFLGIMCIIVLLFAALSLAHGRDFGKYAQSDPATRQWFNSLKNQIGGMCCSMADGASIDDPDWERRGDHYRVRINSEWLDVPEQAVVTGSNRIGRAIVWPVVVNGKTTIRCFMPGAEG